MTNNETPNLDDAVKLDDLLCFSHLRWNFVFQRPQHLLTRFAAERRVFFFEEPIFDSIEPVLDTRRANGVLVAVPHLPSDVDPARAAAMQSHLLRQLMLRHGLVKPLVWYYTPMALTFARDIPARLIVFDCMDELSGFAGAPAQLPDLEQELLRRAALVFTGGRSLHEAKRGKHDRLFLFPSSVDSDHFRRARTIAEDPSDQAEIPRPRIGFFGVIDERIDLDLLARLAQMNPDWHQVMLGPIAKIDRGRLPQAPNIHYLGLKSYAELPAYLAGWDVAMLPFAHNEATRYISPTKTPEYLAAGRPVVSTSIRDVVSPYGERGLVQIADTAEAFTEAIKTALVARKGEWLRRVDHFIADLSWDRTWAAMKILVNEAIHELADQSTQDDLPAVAVPPGVSSDASMGLSMHSRLSQSGTRPV